MSFPKWTLLCLLLYYHKTVVWKYSLYRLILASFRKNLFQVLDRSCSYQGLGGFTWDVGSWFALTHKKSGKPKNSIRVWFSVVAIVRACVWNFAWPCDVTMKFLWRHEKLSSSEAVVMLCLWESTQKSASYLIFNDSLAQSFGELWPKLPHKQGCGGAGTEFLGVEFLGVWNSLGCGGAGTEHLFALVALLEDLDFSFRFYV